ncbi:hypothetical protein GCM10009745_40740 [Kribbella yunnanensis]|uniref:Lipoprotein n=1 Tax=Kribbella yunnanensis TaxID=190194 RepID=A0ABP4TNV5_9ACTN
MPRRPPLGPATAALCALLALTACQGSPEAGRPNTTPPPTSSTPTPTGPSTPAWTAEEQAAIDAAKTRYVAARAAVDRAQEDPSTASHAKLEASGNGGAFLQDVVKDLVFLRDRGLYRSGTTKVSSTVAVAADVSAARPVVVLRSCIDGSDRVLRYRATKKPVPVASGDGARHTVEARLTLAPSSAGSQMWILIEVKTLKPC